MNILNPASAEAVALKNGMILLEKYWMLASSCRIR
jgi:hypothetical protein